MVIEVKTVELAAEKACEGQVDHFEKLVEDMESALSACQDDAYNSNDMLFHLAIARCSGNSILLRMQEVLQDLVRHEIDTLLIPPFVMKNSLQRYKTIFQAIRDRDVEAAVRNMHEHA